MDDKVLDVGGCLIALAVYAVLELATAWVVQWAWNALVPSLLHGPVISFAQAWAIFIILSLIRRIFQMSVKINDKK